MRVVAFVFLCADQALSRPFGRREGAVTALYETKQQYKLVMTADQGISDRGKAVIKAIGAENPDLVIHAGDLGYSRMNGGWSWYQWTNLVESAGLASRYFPVSGNHDSLQEIDDYFGKFFRQKSSDDDRKSSGGAQKNEGGHIHADVRGASNFDLTYFPSCYSFRYQGVHFVGLDSEQSADTSAGDGAAHLTTDLQRVWVEEDLRAAAQDRPDSVAFIVVFLHRPIYSSCHHRANGSHGIHGRYPTPEDPGNALIPWLAPMLDAYRVDLCFYGHAHYYERSYPMHAGVPTTAEAHRYTRGGTVHVVAGVGGYHQYPESYEEDGWAMGCNENAWSFSRIFERYGYLRLTLNRSILSTSNNLEGHSTSLSGSQQVCVEFVSVPMKGNFVESTSADKEGGVLDWFCIAPNEVIESTNKSN